MKIPATVITGFLGAGKTSLIRHLLANANGARLALIINEFGDLGIDREIVAGCGLPACRDEDLVELANGCICCQVADDFLPTMKKLLERDDPPDHIVIETSGLALPKPLVQAFCWPEVRARATVDGVIALVDAAAAAEGRFPALHDPAAGHESPLDEVFEDQVRCADLVVLNKTDLVDAEALARARARVRAALGSGAKMLESVHSALDPRVLLGLSAAAEEGIAARPSHHDGQEGHDHNDFESFVVALPPSDDVNGLEARIREVARAFDVLRMKGFLDVPGRERRLVIQAVGGRVERYFDRPWKAGDDRRGRLVVIGQAGLDRAAIARALAGG